VRTASPPPSPCPFCRSNLLLCPGASAWSPCSMSRHVGDPVSSVCQFRQFNGRRVICSKTIPSFTYHNLSTLPVAGMPDLIHHFRIPNPSRSKRQFIFACYVRLTVSEFWHPCYCRSSSRLALLQSRL
jgi:hypothetical protein